MQRENPRRFEFTGQSLSLNCREAAGHVPCISRKTQCITFLRQQIIMHERRRKWLCESRKNVMTKLGGKVRASSGTLIPRAAVRSARRASLGERLHVVIHQVCDFFSPPSRRRFHFSFLLFYSASNRFREEKSGRLACGSLLLRNRSARMCNHRSLSPPTALFPSRKREDDAFFHHYCRSRRGRVIISANELNFPPAETRRRNQATHLDRIADKYRDPDSPRGAKDSRVSEELKPGKLHIAFAAREYTYIEALRGRADLASSPIFSSRLSIREMSISLSANYNIPLCSISLMDTAKRYCARCVTR